MKTDNRTQITNTCTCQDYDDDTGEHVPASYCDGYCWEDTFEMFKTDIEPIMKKNHSGFWRVENLQFWDGTRSGYVSAHTEKEVLAAMTVNASWILRYEVTEDCINFSLSHHDAPTGSASTIRPLTEKEAEEKGFI